MTDSMVELLSVIGQKSLPHMKPWMNWLALYIFLWVIIMPKLKWIQRGKAKFSCIWLVGTDILLLLSHCLKSSVDTWYQVHP